MDINDILQELNTQHTSRDEDDPFALPNGHSNAGGQADLQALTRAWVNERGTLELLPYPPHNLIPRCTAKIKSQIEKVEEMTSDQNPQSSFTLIILQTDLERWKFLIRSLLRCRLAKIDRHALYYLQHKSERLSEEEKAYAARHEELLHGHFLRSFLGAFPQNLRGMGDVAGGVSMVSGPDEEGGVFARGLGGDGEGGGTIVRGRGRDGDGEIEVGRGEVVVGRWSDVRDLIEKGEMELV